jgi:hypothetical protein
VIAELKAINGIADIHVAQALSYMKATGIQVGLIINFGGDSLTWKRLIRAADSADLADFNPLNPVKPRLINPHGVPFGHRPR